jgi:hypothetical protein
MDAVSGKDQEKSHPEKGQSETEDKKKPSTPHKRKCAARTAKSASASVSAPTEPEDGKLAGSDGGEGSEQSERRRRRKSGG